MFTNNIELPIKDSLIHSTIHKPPDSKAIVLVSHGPGSGRFNHRNRLLSEQLYNAGFAVLLFDWNKSKEIEERTGNFDPIKMAKTIGKIVLWLKNDQTLKNLPTVVFGSSTGAAASLIAASKNEDLIQAVISRNGRLELAEPYLEDVKSPTLILVGKNDYHLMERNKKAYEKLNCPKSMVVLPGICPFFEEPEKMKKVGNMAINWINKYVIHNPSLPASTTYQYS